MPLPSHPIQSAAPNRYPIIPSTIHASTKYRSSLIGDFTYRLLFNILLCYFQIRLVP